jgi:hypothetical protein
MTRDDILRMARRAGFTLQRDEWLLTDMLERFAALVAAAKDPQPPTPHIKPLSREDIVNIYETPQIAGSYFETGVEKAIAITRFVERAHNIK